MSIYPSISSPCCVLICFASCAEKVLPMKNCFFLWTNTSEVEQKQFGADQKSDRMENFALGQQISNGLVRNWKYLENYDFPFKNLNMSQLLLLGKFEYGGGPIFKVVLEC